MKFKPFLIHIYDIPSASFTLRMAYFWQLVTKQATKTTKRFHDRFTILIHVIWFNFCEIVQFDNAWSFYGLCVKRACKNICIQNWWPKEKMNGSATKLFEIVQVGRFNKALYFQIFLLLFLHNGNTRCMYLCTIAFRLSTIIIRKIVAKYQKLSIWEKGKGRKR